MQVLMHPAFTSQSLKSIASEYKVGPNHVARPLLKLAVNNARGRTVGGEKTTPQRELARMRCTALVSCRYEVVAAYKYCDGWTVLDVNTPTKARTLIIARGEPDKYRDAASVRARLMRCGNVGGRQAWLSIFDTVITRR